MQEMNKDNFVKVITEAWLEIGKQTEIENVKRYYKDEERARNIEITEERYKEEIDGPMSIDDFECLEGESDSYQIIHMNSQGGVEGGGEDAWLVAKLIIKESGEELFVHFDGYYNSWEGTEWNDFWQVFPLEEKVINYYTKEALEDKQK